MRDIVKDINGTLYCNLYNYENVFCWFLSTLHKLHSSRTLNGRLNQESIFSDDNLLRPLQIYATLRTDNYVEVYEQIKQWFEYAYQYVFHEDSRHGHDPTIAFYYIYLPLIHYHFKDNFQDIINELNIEYINTVESTIHSTIYNRPITHHPETFYDYYIEMINDKSYSCRSDYKENYKEDHGDGYDSYSYSISSSTNFNEFSDFTAGIFTVSPNKNDNNLHAIAIVKTNSGYTIIDDHNAQKSLAEYIGIHAPHHLYMLTIKDISANEVGKINEYLRQNNIQEQFWSTVYGYKIMFEQKIIPRAISYNNEPKVEELSYSIINGGRLRNIICYILLVIFIVIVLIIWLKNKHTFYYPLTNNSNISSGV